MNEVSTWAPWSAPTHADELAGAPAAGGQHEAEGQGGPTRLDRDVDAARGAVNGVVVAGDLDDRRLRRGNDDRDASRAPGQPARRAEAGEEWQRRGRVDADRGEAGAPRAVGGHEPDRARACGDRGRQLLAVAERGPAGEPAQPRSGEPPAGAVGRSTGEEDRRPAGEASSGEWLDDRHARAARGDGEQRRRGLRLGET